MSNSSSIVMGIQSHLISPPPEPAGKRIVLIDADGLPHIIGYAPIQPEDRLSISLYGATEPPVEFGLVKVTPRSYIFHEIMPLASGKFNETFDKNQV